MSVVLSWMQIICNTFLFVIKSVSSQSYALSIQTISRPKDTGGLMSFPLRHPDIHIWLIKCVNEVPIALQFLPVNYSLEGNLIRPTLLSHALKCRIIIQTAARHRFQQNETFLWIKPRKNKTKYELASSATDVTLALASSIHHLKPSMWKFFSFKWKKHSV